MKALTSKSLHWVLAAVAAGLALALAVTALAAWRRAAAEDAALAQREAVAIRRAIALAGEVAAAELVPLAVGDEQAQKVAVGRDLPWLRSAYGSPVFPHGEDEYAILVAPDGKPLFASRSNGPPSLAEAAPALDAAAPLIERVRRVYRNSVEPDPADPSRQHLRLPSQDAMVRAIYDHDVAEVEGRPSLVTVIAIQPTSPVLLRQEDPAVLVDVRDLGGRASADLGRAAQVEDLRIAPIPRSVEPNPAGEILKDSAGQPSAVLLWSRAAPGARALRSAIPVFVMLLLLCAVAGVAAAARRRALADRLAEQEAALLRALRHDVDTGLANRGWFRSRLAALLRDAADQPFALMLVDVDDLKVINDTMGQDAGDAVLAAVAGRLREREGADSTAGRLGGDAFALLVRPAVGPAPFDRAGLAARVGELSVALARPAPFGDRSIPLTVSIGAALAPADGDAADHLFRHAHIALLRARREGRGRWAVFDPQADAALASALAAAEASLAALKSVATKVPQEPASGRGDTQDRAATA